MHLISNLVISSFIITSQGFFGTTTTGETFSQVQVMESPRIEVFKLNDKPLWYVCEGGIMEDLRDLSVCVSKTK